MSDIKLFPRTGKRVKKLQGAPKSPERSFRIRRSLNVDNANSPAFADFHEFFNSFNKRFKTSIAALCFVQKMVKGSGGARILQGMIEATDEPWSKQLYYQDAEKLVKDAINEQTLNGLVEIHSAMDTFIEKIRADHEKWLRFKKRILIKGRANNDPEIEPLAKLCIERRWNYDSMEGISPILKYFRLARDCVAHRSGIVAPALERHCLDSDLASAARHLSDRQDIKIPEPPVLRKNEKLILQPRFAILALTAIYKACDGINKKFIEDVGVAGLVYLAAYHSLLRKNPPIIRNASRSAVSVVNYVLQRHYRVKIPHYTATIRVLKELNTWGDCVTRHKTLFLT